MMMIPFSKNGWEIRTLEKDGEPWFVARDIAKALGYYDTDQAVRSHCKKANDFSTRQNNGGYIPPMKIIPESDLYRLVMRSQLKSAEEFQDWVMEEVLPSIRKTGSYSSSVPQTFADALLLAASQAKQLETQAPLVEFAESIQLSEDNITLNEMAKLSGKMGRNTMMSLMRGEGILMASNLPYQTFISRGYFEIYENAVRRKFGIQLVLSTQVTAKGQVWMIKRINGWVEEMRPKREVYGE